MTKEKFLKIGSIFLALAMIVGLVYLIIPKEKELTVDSFSWECNIAIERYQKVDESGWHLPSGARLQYSRQELYGYERVLSHYDTKTRQVSEQVLVGYETYVTGHTDLGNGTFRENTSQRPVYETRYHTETYQEPVYRDEPIYKTKYYYEIDKWLYERSVSTSGEDRMPYWGEVVLAADERQGSQGEKYYVLAYTTDEELNTYTIDYSDWLVLEPLEVLKVKVYLGNYIEIVKENDE